MVKLPKDETIMKRINAQGQTYMQDIYDKMGWKSGDWMRCTMKEGKVVIEKA